MSTCDYCGYPFLGDSCPCGESQNIAPKSHESGNFKMVRRTPEDRAVYMEQRWLEACNKYAVLRSQVQLIKLAMEEHVQAHGDTRALNITYWAKLLGEFVA